MRKVLSWCREALIPRGKSKKQLMRDMGITLALLSAAAMICASLNALGHSDSVVPLVFVRFTLTLWEFFRRKPGDKSV